MPVSGDTRQALRLLERIQVHLKDSDASQLSPSIGDDLNTLISVLDSPVFNSILNIQDSLQELKKQLHKHPSILPVDFDISPTTGELVLSVPSDPIPHHQNSDSYEQSSDAEQNYDYESVSRARTKHERVDDGDKKVSMSLMTQPDYALSAITTDGYAEEFQRTIDQGAQGRDIHNLQLFKPEGSSLGFSVVGLRSEQKGELGIFIQEIQQNGIAGRDGRLQEGDQILAIDGQPLDSNISHQQAISILQQARGLVELVVARGGIHNATTTAAALSTILSGSPEHQHTLLQPGAPVVSLERSPSALSAGSSSKGSDMVLNTEWAQVEAIDLVNDGSGLGFGIIGGRSTGVVVKTILPGGVADRDGRLRSGDHILQIGEVNLRGMGSEQVAMVLRQSGSHVRLVVARPVDPTSGPSASHTRTAALVPTRILADPDEVEKHLAMFQQSMNGFSEPSPYKGPADVGDNFVYQRELNGGTNDYYGAPFSECWKKQDHGRIEGDQPDSGVGSGPRREGQEDEELPEMETFEVELVKDQLGLGITIAGYVCEKEEISGIFVKSVAKGSAADLCGQIRVNDQIIEVDGRPLHGYTNHQAVEVLRNTGKLVKLRLARYLRGAKFQQLQLAIASGELSYPSQPIVQAHDATSSLTEATNKNVDLSDTSFYVDNDFAGYLDQKTEACIRGKWNKIMGPEYEIVVAQLSKFREGGGLGISLEGTVDVEDGKEVRPHHYIRSILPDGPVGVNGRLHSGDELLEVNGERLFGMNHHSVVATLKELPLHVRMVCARRLLPPERELPPSLLRADSSQPYLEYDLSSASEFARDRGNLLGQFGGSLTSLTPISERLVKAKSDGSLAVGTSASSSPPMEASLSKLKSRSLEPLTGLAMWSNDPQIIELMKGDRGLGFSILDYQDPMNPNETVIVIRSLVPGGVAQQDGRLIPGDRLLFVNDINLENASLDAAVQALKGAPKGVVKIGVAKPLPLPESSQASGQFMPEDSPIKREHPLKPFDLPLRLPSFPSMDYDQVTQEAVNDTLPSPVVPSSEPVWKYNIAGLPTALEQTIRIKKGSDILGFRVDVVAAVGGVVVSSIADGSAAGKDGRVAPGDFLTCVNNCTLFDLTEEQVAKVLQQADELSTEAVIKFIPAVDAAVHHQSALLSLDREMELRQESDVNLTDSKGTEDDDDQYFDISDMEPPDDPPPPLPSVPPPLEEPILVPPETVTQEHGKTILHIPSATPEQPLKDPQSNQNNEALKSLEKSPVRSPKPAVPLKPIRKSLIHSQAPSVPLKEKPKTSIIESLVTDISCTTLSRQWGPSRTVELWKDPNKGLGISIISGKADTLKAGIFIKHVLPDSPAGWNGTLKRGDRILEVSGVDISHADHAKAVEVIKNAQNPVKFIVQSLVPVPKKFDSDITATKLTSALPCSIVTQQSTVSTISSIPTECTSSSASCVLPLIKCSSAVSKSSPTTSLSSSSSFRETETNRSPIEKEPPIPPQRTVSKGLFQSPSNVSDKSIHELKTEDSFNVQDLPEGKALTKNGFQIDIASAGNIKLTAEAKTSDAEQEDDFGYTHKKIHKKYGDMKGELIIVEIVKGSNKLGLSLVGNKDRNKMSVFVCGMHPNGVAAKDGKIKIGDELLEVNGVIMHGRCHLNASAMIKGLSGTAYKILLLRREGAVEEMAVKPLSQFPSELDEEATEDKYCHYRGMRTVTVRKGAHGLGIMIIEGKHAEVGQGIFISDIQENSAAEQAGLCVGDMILSANETDLVGADYDTAASILKQAEGLITLIVANPNKPASGYIYEDDKKSDDIMNWSEEKTLMLKALEKRKEKSAPPTLPPKPVHLLGKSATNDNSSNACPSDISSQLPIHHQQSNSVSTEKSNDVIIPTLANVDVDNLSFQGDNELLLDPKRCDIKPGQETMIEIVKEKIGLGLSIVGGSDTPLGAVIIHEVYPDGAAALDGRVRPGDQILEVNGEDLRESAHEHAITTLRQTPAVVSMLVYREEGHNHEDDCMEIIEVELQKKSGRGLGLSIVGRKNGPGVFISEVVKGGIAEADGRLIQGDQIISVNGQDLKSATQEHAAAVLKTTMGIINMKIGRLKAGSRRSTSCLTATPKTRENMDNQKCKTIILEQGPDGLGFSIVGGFGSPHGDLPIYVKKVFDKGAASEEGQLRRGDQIVTVNDQSLHGFTHEDAVAVLKKVTGTVTLAVLS